MSGFDLDLPTMEFENENEKIDNEDEKDNYYGKGEDDHTDLELNTGDEIL